MTSLLSLPNELLQHIACHLPFSSLVNLQCASRRLHDVCRDRLVIQNVARYGHLYDPGLRASISRLYSASNRIDLQPEHLEWREASSLLGDATFDMVRKVACAVQRGSALATAPATNDDWTLRIAQGKILYDVSEWLPQLLALHHPVTLALEPNTFFGVHGEATGRQTRVTSQIETPPADQSPSVPVLKASHQEQVADLVNVSFIVNYVTLQRLGTTWNPDDVICMFEDFFCPQSTARQTSAQATNNNSRIEETFGRLCERVPNYGEQHNPFTLSQASSILLSLIFSIAVQFPTIAEYGLLPKPNKIAFPDFMDIGSVFDATSDNFSICHLHEMTSPEFLSGQWIGYYSDQRYDRSLSNRNLFDPPMHEICIVARGLSPHDATARGARTKIDRQTKGVDSLGEFHLEGRVYANGTVDIAKWYHGAHAWVWTGHVTPFGIVGHWGSQWGFGGYFWIWKEEWC
jgi:hypothetical protein